MKLFSFCYKMNNKYGCNCGVRPGGFGGFGYYPGPFVGPGGFGPAGRGFFGPNNNGILNQSLTIPTIEGPAAFRVEDQQLREDNLRDTRDFTSIASFPQEYTNVSNQQTNGMGARRRHTTGSVRPNTTMQKRRHH